MSPRTRVLAGGGSRRKEVEDSVSVGVAVARWDFSVSIVGKNVFEVSVDFQFGV